MVLAGFMRILDRRGAGAVGRPHDQHPSIPAAEVSAACTRIAARSKRAIAEHGASVHFVTAELDGGPVIAQARLPIEAGDDELQLAQRLLPLEHRLLPAVLGLLVSRRLQLARPRRRASTASPCSGR